MSIEDFLRKNPTIVESLRDAAGVCERHAHTVLANNLRRYAQELSDVERNMEVLWKG